MAKRENFKPSLRPVDLAREAGVSTQAVRNYEDEGILPSSIRLVSGHRRYTIIHLEALKTFMALTSATGRPRAAVIMCGINTGDMDNPLAELDVAHAQLLADRDTIESLASHLDESVIGRPAPLSSPLSPVELSRRIGLTTTTLRAWEKIGILIPQRNSDTGHRHYFAADVRDAELAHLLRRGGHGLAGIARTISAVRDHGGAVELVNTVNGWRQQLNARARALLAASAALDHYVRVLDFG